MNKIKVLVFPVGRQKIQQNKYAFIVATTQFVKKGGREGDTQPRRERSPFMKAVYKRVKATRGMLEGEWREWQGADPGTLKGKTHAYFLKGKSLLDPHELLMVNLSDGYRKNKPQTLLEIVHPSAMTADEARQEVDSMLTTVLSGNSMYIGGYALLLPVTSLAAVLPGPNIFVLANALRLYSLYLTRNTATELLRCLQPAEGSSTARTVPQSQHTVKFTLANSINVKSIDWMDTVGTVDSSAGAEAGTSLLLDSNIEDLIADVNELVDSLECDVMDHKLSAEPRHIQDESRRSAVRAFMKYHNLSAAATNKTPTRNQDNSTTEK
jgi:hypothetical protein